MKNDLPAPREGHPVRRFFRWALLVLAVVLVLLGQMPVADVPVLVYDGGAALVPLFSLLAAGCGWGYLALSPRRGRDLLLAAWLNMAALLTLCRAVRDLAECCFYYG